MVGLSADSFQIKCGPGFSLQVRRRKLPSQLRKCYKRCRRYGLFATIRHPVASGNSIYLPISVRLQNILSQTPLVNHLNNPPALCKTKSAITNTANTTLAMPLAVINARFTLLKSVGFTTEC